MSRPLPSCRVTYEEYVRLAEADDRRLELIDGFIHPQAEPSRRHERIISNLSLSIGPAVRAAGCDFFTRGAVWSPERRSELLPDWLVVCDARDLQGDGPELTRSRYRYPRLVVEVLSPSNTGAEMAAKFSAYNAVASIESYLIVDSTSQQVWSYARSGPNLVESTGRNASVIDTPFGPLTFEQIYNGSGAPSIASD